MPGPATRIAALQVRCGVASQPGDGSGTPPAPGGCPAERPPGASPEAGVAKGGMTRGDGEVLGGGGGDGSGAGAWALGEGAVVLGSLAVPARAMCGDGVLGAVPVRAELAKLPDPTAGSCPRRNGGGPALVEPGTDGGRMTPIWWSTPPTSLVRLARVATVSAIKHAATTSGRPPRKGACCRCGPGWKRGDRRLGRQESISQRMISAHSASSRPRVDDSPVPLTRSVIEARWPRRGGQS
jgi:hypothetical protein